jgi:hypothetical protein
MAIQISSLTDISPTRIESMFATLSQLMQERHPEIELTRGVFHDLVLYFNSVLGSAMQENIDRVLYSNSLQKINENPALADDAVVDQVLSNYNLTRDVGTQASGAVTVILPNAVTTTISAATKLTANNVTFRTTATFRLLPPGENTTDQYDRIMIAVGDGTYAATIPVRATVPGVIGNIRRGTKMLPDFIPNNITDIYAAVDFIDGQDAPTNAEYISKLAPALAAKTIGGRQSYVAAIKNEPTFANIQHLSILGCGDAEQHRDQHGLFPISGGGKVDIYVQSAAYQQERDFVMDALYVGPGPIGTIWQLVFDRTLLDKEQCSGMYEVVRVAKLNAPETSGYGITSDNRFSYMASLDFVPSIKYTYETTYTRYQTVNVQFNDTDKAPLSAYTPGVTRARYAVRTSSMPLIADLQDHLSDRDVRARAADVLVRAAIPCFTKIEFQVRKDVNEADPDFTAIKNAVSAKISSLGFTGQLHASQIAGVVQPLLIGKQALSAIDMFGRIRRPDGKNIYVRNPSILRIPDDPTHLVTGRTTVFLTRPEDVSVVTVNAGFAD